MSDMIKCPSCAENNLPDQEFCQYCQTRLQPLTDPLDGADAPIKPGQAPTKKNTAELEPILPQWLRDARDSARKDDQQATQQNLQQPSQLKPASSAKDLLAGLQSQAGDDEEDDMPDWLASITGVNSKPIKSQTESFAVRWVELGGKDDFAKDESDGSSSDLAGLKSSEPQPDENNEVRDWFRNLGNPEQAQQPEQSDSTDSDLPDWLRVTGSQNEKSKSADSADHSESGVGEPPAGIISEEAESPSDSPKPNQDKSFEWLKSTVPATSSREEIPDWLSNDAAVPPAFTAAEDESAELKDAQSNGISDRLETVALQSPSSLTAVEDEPSGGISDRLKAVEFQSPIHTESEEKTIEPAQDADTLGWLDTFQAVSAYQPENSLAQVDFTPLDFAEDFQASDNMDGLFTDIPDGLLSTLEAPPSSLPTADTNSEAIAPDDQPSWVESMRPVDSDISELSSNFPADQTVESSGVLAGLSGVLPSGLGFAQMSRPKAYSTKLQVSDEQLAQAALLEQILAAETAPVPIASFSVLRTSRSLRWFLAFIVFVMITIPLFMRTQMFSLPVGVPMDVNGALQVAQAIPESAPVLVAFDYEPARVGEMEAAAAPMFDQMILLRHPHLTFISTNETGAILVERFISGPLAVHNYQSGIQYLNLGYLPGGQMGIRAFAQNPVVTSPFDMSLSSAWDSIPLEGISSLSQFAALIVVTDDAEAARTWIEQTESARGAIPFVVISSAQAAPMIQPYYESQQISGLVSGLYGGALFEQYNAGRPGSARAYWDAYSLGMLLAMALVLVGGLWNLALGLRERVAAGETQ
ncbi:MAG TPA: zinc ribbon domain-containing protein [Anaerolineales bacterium]|nr:zinc ribbon domain-containing protein [Anaerolineales bacterium]